MQALLENESEPRWCLVKVFFLKKLDFSDPSLP